MRALSTLLLSLVLLTGLTAGCIGTDEAPPVETASTPDTDLESTGEATDPLALDSLGPEDTLDSPPIPPEGRSYTWTWTEGAWDQIPATWTTVVATQTPASFLMAPDDTRVAAIDAQWRWVTVGEHATSDLSGEAGSGVFDYLSFPLQDGATWTSTWGLGEGGVEVSHEATYVPSIDTGNGAYPGYRIVATPGESSAPFVYDYVPAIGYLTSIGVQDGDGTWSWRWEVTDWGDEWTGTVYTATSEQVLAHVYEVDTSLDDGTPGQTGLQPEPMASFEVSSEADHVFVQGGAYAWAGTTEVRLTDPDGGEQTLQALSPAPDGDVAVISRFLDPVEGTWEATFAGAGADTAGWLDVWQAVVEPVEID